MFDTKKVPYSKAVKKHFASWSVVSKVVGTVGKFPMISRFEYRRPEPLKRIIWKELKKVEFNTNLNSTVNQKRQLLYQV